MRLVFITGSLVHGGAERHTITLANRLAERGHECHAVYVKNDPSQLERLRGVPARCLHARRYLDFTALRQLCLLTKELDPAVIVAANPYALMYAWIALRVSRMRAALAVTFHTTVPRSAKDWLKLLYYRPLFWSAECALFVCEAQRRYWRRRGLFARRNEVIYNGVDLEQWQPSSASARAAIRKVLGFSETDFVIGMSAVLRPEKNPLQLVDALAGLRRRGIPARALFIGDGEMRPALEAHARAAGVAGEVLITGLQSDVRPLVSACDAMTLCSTAIETFSLAALESMALARPVVHAALGGAAEMVRPGHDGWLFPVGDTRALVERLAALADARVRARMGANARETAEARFSERAMVERYEQVLLELETARGKREHLRRAAGAH
jgi:glycosyltransferase involved in cell wall biosynthesis